MAGDIYVIITGSNNRLWPRCLEQNLVAMGFDTPYFETWFAKDYDAYLALQQKDAITGTPQADIKAQATLWFNRATKLTQSAGDLWLHREGTDLYWAETTDAEAVFDPIEGDEVMIAKPVTKWSNRNQKTQTLGWDSIHPKARNYIVTQQAMFHIANADMQNYFRALVGGAPLDPWHNRPDWKAALGDKSLVKYPPLTEFAIIRMLETVKQTVANSSGQVVQRTMKNKELRCSENELRSHIAELMEQQGGICRLTGLQMHLDKQDGADLDMLVSLDRIDSSGHYEIGNLQLVCRFVNFWKSSQDNGRFLELLDLIVERRTLS